MFDVDIAEGAPTLKLPFNVGENPYDAAERFLETNGLDPGYREQVVNFITQNVGEDAFKNAGSDVSADPFTGAGAYVPSAPGACVPAHGRRADGPFVPRARARTFRARVAAPRSPAPSSGNKSFSSSCPRSRTSASSSRPPRSTRCSRRLNRWGLPKKSSARSRRARPRTRRPLDPSATAALTKALADWPVESLFPLLDLCKALCARFDTDAGRGAGCAGRRRDGGGVCARAASAAPGPNADANALTAARLFANAFQRSSPRRAFASTAPSVLDGLARNVARNADAKPAARLALATALLNVSAHFSDSDASSFVSEEIAAQAASVGAELLMHAMPSDGADAAAEVLFFRGLVALGTFAAKSPGTKASLRDLGVAELAEAVRSHVVFKGGTRFGRRRTSRRRSNEASSSSNATDCFIVCRLAVFLFRDDFSASSVFFAVASGAPRWRFPAHGPRMDAPFWVFEGVTFQSFFLGPMFPGLGLNALERPSSRTATCFMPTVFASQ